MENLYNIPDVTTGPAPNKDEIIYAASVAEGDKQENYINALNEATLTGQSSLVIQERNKWIAEQEQIYNKSVEELIVDESISLSERRKIIENYLINGLPIKNLRDKFLIQSASTAESNSIEDIEAQNEYAATVIPRDNTAQQQGAIQKAAITYSLFAERMKKEVKGSVEVSRSLASKLLLSIPLGWAALFASLVDLGQEDESKKVHAEKILDLVGEWGQNPTTEKGKEIEQNLADIAEIIDIPFKALGDATLEATGSAALATLAYVGTGTFNIAGGYKYGFKHIKGKKKVSPTSPLGTTEAASKESAGNIAATVLQTKSSAAAEAINTTKAEILNTYVLPKIPDEFGPIHPDIRNKLAAADKDLNAVYDYSEFNPHVTDVDTILAERDQYITLMSETERSHLLLSSSVLDITPEKTAFGRKGSQHEAYVISDRNQLSGTAVFGRNSYYGYSTHKKAENYQKKLEAQAESLPDKGNFQIIERDGQFYIQWDFKREYNEWEHLSFGAESLTAHAFHKGLDITKFANSPVGEAIFPSYMRMDSSIPVKGATTAWREGHIEKAFINAQRDLFLGTKHPKELSNMTILGEEEGKVWSAEDFIVKNQHLTRAENIQLHGEYVGFRRIQDHLYKFVDRKFRSDLIKDGMKSLFDESGAFIAHATEALTEVPADVTRVWDITNKTVVKTPKNQSIVRLSSPVLSGDHVLQYAVVSPKHQFGPIYAGALPKIPGYIARHYKEWFVVDKIPTARWVNGKKVAASELRDHKQAVAMAGTLKEANNLLEKLQLENKEATYNIRREEKEIEDKIIHDSKVYETYLKETHKRGSRIPSLDRPSRIEDILVAQTKAIRNVAKTTAWSDLTEVRQKAWLKAFGKFSQGKWPQQLSDIVALRRMNKLEEREFLTAQKIFEQMNREQVANTTSDIMWKSTMNYFADVIEKTDISAEVLREWGQRGFVPLRGVKTIGSHIWLYWRVPRMLLIQPQQAKELMFMTPSYAKSVKDIIPILMGLLGKSRTFKPLASQIDDMGRRVVDEYDDVLQALEESGIMQAVDMNQMIHGMWRDVTKELSPQDKSLFEKAYRKGTEGIATTAGLPGKLGRSLGYDVGELTNQVTLWLYSRHRWIEENPGKDWKTHTARAQIAEGQSLYGHMASTRAGMFKWQDGIISAFTQFVAIPWKSTLQMMSAKEFTGAEKARLAAARLFWYGKYGLPIGAALYAAVERNVDDPEDRETLARWTESMTNRIYNGVLDAFVAEDGDRPARVEAGKSLSTVVDTVFLYDIIETLVKMSSGEKPDQRFPFVQAGTSLFDAVRTMHDIFYVDNRDITDPVAQQAAIWTAVSFAGVLSDYGKYQLIEGISKSGQLVGVQQTRAEAVARLAGIMPVEEFNQIQATKSLIDRQKDIKKDAKEIHTRLIALQKALGTSSDSFIEYDRYLSGLNTILFEYPESYRNELINAVLSLSRYNAQNKKEAILLNIYNHYNDKYDADLEDARHVMEKTEEGRELMKDLDAQKGK